MRRLDSAFDLVIDVKIDGFTSLPHFKVPCGALAVLIHLSMSHFDRPKMTQV